jgi:hypothetical protein
MVLLSVLPVLMDVAEKLPGARNLRYCYGRAISPLGRLPQPETRLGRGGFAFFDTQSGAGRFRNPHQIQKILSKYALSGNFQLPSGVAWMDAQFRARLLI